MKSTTSDGGPRYWLLTGDVPQGPFDVAQIHGKLESGEANPHTQACPLGGSIWRQLRDVIELPNHDGETAPRPLSEKSQPGLDVQEGWRRDWDEVRTAAFWVWAFITFLAAPSLATIFTVVTSGPKAGLDEAQEIWQVFLLTFPLALGVAIDSAILLLIERYDAWPSDRPAGQPLSGQQWLFLGLLAVLLASAGFGNSLGMGVAPVDVPDVKGRGAGQLQALVFAVLQLLANYFTLYGPQLFVSSVFVGVFMGWAMASKLVPNALAALSASERERVIREHRASKLRAQLLQDLGDVALRRQYLEVRTKWQEVLDSGLPARVVPLLIAAVAGVGLGPVLARNSTNPGIQAIGPNLMAVVAGVAVPLGVGYVVNGDDRRKRRLELQRTLGPLPADAPLDPEAARSRFLPGGPTP